MRHPITAIDPGTPKSIIGLDCATKTGWCVMSPFGNVMESGVQDFAKKRGESNGLMFLRFRKWLLDLVSMADKPLIVYEQAHHRGGAATEICVNLTGRVQEVAAKIGSECATVRTTSLKKWATGSGKASKGDMIAWARGRLGREPIDDNEADAVAIAAWARDEYMS